MLLRNWKKHSRNISIWQYRKWHSKVPEKNKLKKILPNISAETFISHKQWLGCWLGSTLQKEFNINEQNYSKSQKRNEGTWKGYCDRAYELALHLICINQENKFVKDQKQETVNMLKIR